MVRKWVGLSLCVLCSGLNAAQAQTPNLSPPKTVWDADPGGVALHLQSGLQCPINAGEFHRSGLAMYDQAGLDVSCSYKTEKSDITFFLTLHDQAALADTFETAKKAVVRSEPSAMLRDDTLAPPPGNKWLQASFAEKGGAVRSELFLSLLSGWMYEIRATYKPDDAGAVDAAIASLNAMVMKTAGQHLAACAAAQAPVVGTPVNGSNSTLVLGLTMGGLLRAETLVPQQFDETAVWCAQHGVAVGGQPYVYWRNLAANAKGVVDRITAVEGYDQIVVVADPKGAALAQGVAPGSKIQDVYDLFVDGKDTIQLMGFYDRRPSLAMIMQRLADHRPAYAELRKSDKKTTVFWTASAKN